MAEMNDARNESQGHWNFGDSVGVLALIFAILAVDLVPTPLFKFGLLLLAVVGIAYCLKKSHWTHTWPPALKFVAWAFLAFVLSWILIGQIDGQLVADHSRTVGEAATAFMGHIGDFGKRLTASKLFWIVVGMLLLRATQVFFSNVRSSLARTNAIGKTDKGFLDYKLQAENAVTELPRVLDGLTQIMGRVSSMIGGQAPAMHAALSRPTKVQIHVVAEVARKLDAYSQQMEKRCVRLEAIGRALSEGMSGWFGWMKGRVDLTSEAAPLVAVLEGAATTIGQTINHEEKYIESLSSSIGVSQDMNSALDRHIAVNQRVRDASATIAGSCRNALDILRQGKVVASAKV